MSISMSSSPRPLHLSISPTSIVSSPSSYYRSPLSVTTPASASTSNSNHNNSNNAGVGTGVGVTGGNKEIKAKRRQSSIAYFPPDSTSSSRRGSAILQRRNSIGDGFSTHANGTSASTSALVSSPTSCSTSTSTWRTTRDRSGVVSLPPSASIMNNNNENNASRSHSHSHSASLVHGTPHRGLGARERPPLTLTEKHADLLRFIAQKESKCLELRSQLAVHEAELVQLKDKWKRIVNRGLERESSSSTSATSPHLPSTPYTMTGIGTTMTNDSGNGNTNVNVLEGIKEGMQGVSRLIAAGFSISDPSSSISTSSSSPSHNRRTTTSKITTTTSNSFVNNSKTKTRSTPNSARSHSNKESSSSVSTFVTSSTSVSGNARFSQSSVSSLGEDDSCVNNVLKNEDGKEDGSMESTKSTDDDDGDDDQVQVLMVRDTGATPTMSPNPEFHQQKQKQKLKQEQNRRKLKMEDIQSNYAYGPKSPLRPLNLEKECQKRNEIVLEERVFKVKDEVEKEEDEDCSKPWSSSIGVGMENGKVHQRKSLNSQQSYDFGNSIMEDLDLLSPSSTSRGGGVGSSSFGNSNSNSRSTSPSRHSITRTTSPLPPTSKQSKRATVHFGVTPIASNATPAPVSSWMDSVGKKLGQIQKSSTFTVNQKRASILFSDMSQSIVSALTNSSTPVSVSASNTGSPISSGLGSANTVENGGNGRGVINGSKVSSSTVKKGNRGGSSSLSVSSMSMSMSLLDDNDDEEDGEMRIAGKSLIPSPSPSLSPSPYPSSSPRPTSRNRISISEKVKEKVDDDDEEWNW